MKITVVGSADATNSAGRGNACYLVESPGAEKLMVDFGPTALSAIKRLGIQPSELGGIAFTHLHGDHTGGYPTLCIETMFGGGKNELAILGPPLTRKTLAEVFHAAYAELESEIPERMHLDIDELGPGEQRSFAGYRIQAFAADHMAAPHQALCLRVTDAHGKSVAFSGDSRLCPGLLAAGDGVDLLVADCSKVAPPAGAHATWQDWQSALPNLTTRRLLLTHLGSEMRQRGAELIAIAQPPIDVALADDGMVLEI